MSATSCHPFIIAPFPQRWKDKSYAFEFCELEFHSGAFALCVSIQIQLETLYILCSCKTFVKRKRWELEQWTEIHSLRTLSSKLYPCMQIRFPCSSWTWNKAYKRAVWSNHSMGLIVCLFGLYWLSSTSSRRGDHWCLLSVYGRRALENWSPCQCGYLLWPAGLASPSVYCFMFIHSPAWLVCFPF